jgi:RND family efflux transporter MFP subunit
MMDDDQELDGQPARPRRFGRLLAGAVAILALLAIGALGGAYWTASRAGNGAMAAAPVMPSSSPPPSSTPAGSPPAAGASGSREEAVEVTLTSDAVQRAGIKTAAVGAVASTSGITVPGTVAPNAYRDTKVNALVGGIVRQVAPELGAAVARGQTLAVIFSSELADAQMKYLSMRAMLVADHQKRERTEKLVGIGAASRQELEEVRALHAAHETEVAAARQRLLLLGLPQERVAKLQDASQIVSEVQVPSPASGTVVMRSVNPGQVVTAGQELFTVTDLGSVWVIGDVYEADFATVRVGSEATITVQGQPAPPLRGRVAYIDPRVDLATRTAKVRVEVPNRDGRLRFGMFVTVSFQTAPAQRVMVVPRSAVQSIGERMVVYVPAEGEEGKFLERTVKLGPPAGDAVQVLEGLKPGEKVVTEGSFFLRAEAARSRSGG